MKKVKDYKENLLHDKAESSLYEAGEVEIPNPYKVPESDR